MASDKIEIPVSLFQSLYRFWLDEHGCHVEHCYCMTRIAQYERLMAEYKEQKRQVWDPIPVPDKPAFRPKRPIRFPELDAETVQVMIDELTWD